MSHKQSVELWRDNAIKAQAAHDDLLAAVYALVSISYAVQDLAEAVERRKS